jgi:hypothetical protein
MGFISERDLKTNGSINNAGKEKKSKKDYASIGFLEGILLKAAESIVRFNYLTFFWYFHTKSIAI